MADELRYVHGWRKGFLIAYICPIIAASLRRRSWSLGFRGARNATPTSWARRLEVLRPFSSMKEPRSTERASRKQYIRQSTPGPDAIFTPNGKLVALLKAARWQPQQAFDRERDEHPTAFVC
ncbi:hypothetical protein GOC68_33095 [Sinorhizobium medicae]|nr:hypothetical protein [Sinorhizobium medicae]